MSTAAARLKVISGNAAGSMLIVEDELILGRQAEGDGCLGGDEEISRQHARLSVDASGLCAVEDLGSTNGTFLNGLRITSPQGLSGGDTIELGGTMLVVEELPGAAGADDAPPPLSFQLEVDFEAREARLRLDETSEPVRLVYEEGQWRALPSGPS